MEKKIIRLTEEDLHCIIENSVRRIMTENEEDEGLWGSIKGGLKGIGKAAKGEYNKAKNGVMNTGLNNEYKGQSVGDRLKGGMKYIKNSAKNGSNSEDLDNFMSQLKKCMESGLLGEKGKFYATKLLGTLENTKRGGNGRLTQDFNKRYK